MFTLMFTSKAVTQIKHQTKHTKPADCMSLSNCIASPHSRGSDYGYLSSRKPSEEDIYVHSQNAFPPCLLVM